MGNEKCGQDRKSTLRMDNEVQFLNRSPKVYPLKPFLLPPDGSKHPMELRVDFPSEIRGQAIAKFMLLPNHLLKTVKVPVRRNKITMYMSNHSQDKIEATPDNPIGILDVHSLGFFHIGLEHLKKTHLREYRFKTLHEVEYQMNGMIDFVNDQNNPTRNQTRNNSDPYPWLDPADPHCGLTDEQILDNTVDLSQNCLNSKEERFVMHLIKHYKNAFSL